MTNLIIKAAQLATFAHKGQKRKYNNDPYIFHPIRVAGRVATLPNATEEMVAAAFLHDVLEDTQVLYSELRTAMGDKITNLVIELTNTTHGLSISRVERKAIDRDRLGVCSYEAKVIKFIDRIDNLRDMVNAPEEHKDFFQLYKEESIRLAQVLGSASLELYNELLYLCY